MQDICYGRDILATLTKPQGHQFSQYSSKGIIHSQAKFIAPTGSEEQRSIQLF